MTGKSSRWGWTLSGGLLLGREVSGFYLTLSNFQAVSTLSLPLECIFAYNTPMRGCGVEDFGKDATCSPSCQQGVVRIQTSIQQSCALVSTGERSLLDEAQNGRLVAAICRTELPPPGSASTTSRASSPGFTRPAPDSTSDDASSATATTTRTRAESAATSTPTSISTSTPAIIATAATTPPTHHPVRPASTSTRSTTTSSSAAAQTRFRGGGGSPFDPMPESAAQRRGSGSGAARWLAAAGSCTVGIYLLLY
ncbi:hypothetical protein E4U42_005567 [Claviceps africana]|uniref:Uncharacterized protein n=1 Tax=Claviceps africana TaxID=83212 RepID=A0A8K0JBQ5_9HYPO|nr:hypothetical protein E4U42_005567 [Claviceps africana]